MTTFTYLQNKKLILLVIVVGVFIAFLFGISRASESATDTLFFVVHSIFTTAGIWLGCYTIVTFMWKRFPWERNPIKHLIIEILAILIYVPIFGIIIYKIELSFDVIPSYIQDNISFNRDFIITLLITYFITTVHEAVFFYQQWKFNFSKSVRLEKDNIEAKYETLKAQINPHFLFNSLNSLTLIVNKNEEAVDYIQNLSEHLRYVLKSRDRELVLVRDEVAMLNKYIKLQKSRFRENLIVEFDVNEKFYHYSLPPLVLQILVENSIKHNIISKVKPLTIKIIAEEKSIIVENNLQLRTDVTSTKQGLQNIIDRFSFFTNQEIEIKETKAIFKVEIPLLTVEI